MSLGSQNSYREYWSFNQPIDQTEIVLHNVLPVSEAKICNNKYTYVSSQLNLHIRMSSSLHLSLEADTLGGETL